MRRFAEVPAPLPPGVEGRYARGMALHPTTCPLDCPDACGILVETDDQGELVRVRGNPAHSYSNGVLCSKTSIYHEVAKSEDRLKMPLIREGGSFREVSWERAVGVIAERLAALPGEEILALQYAGSLGLVARKFPMRTMHALGSSLHDGGVCVGAAVAGYETVLGRLVGPDIEEAEDADAIVLWASDIKRSVQHLQPRVQRRAKAGIPVLAIDIYRTDTMRAVEKWGGRGLLIRPGTDAALALSITRLAFERGWVDRERLAANCVGSAEFEAHLAGAPTIPEAAAITGFEEREIVELAELLWNAQNLFLRTGAGWTRRTNGAMGMRALCSMVTVLGQEDRLHFESADLFQLEEDGVERPDLRSGSAKVTKQVELGDDLVAGRFGAALVWGHNPAVTLPNAGAVRRGFARDDFFLVVHDQFLTETAQQADVVLPATCFLEHSDVYRSYGHRLLQYGKRAIPPPGEARSNVDAFGAIARELELPAPCWDVTTEEVCEELLEASAERLGADALKRLLAGEPVKLEPPGGDRGTPSGKIELLSESAAAAGQPALATWIPERPTGGDGAFSLVCAASVHTHNSTYSHSRRHLERQGRPHCHLNPEDARELGLAAGDPALLSNEVGRLTFPVRLAPEMPRGLVRVDGMPRSADTPEGIGINALNDGTVADLGGGATYFSTRVDVGRAPAR